MLLGWKDVVEDGKVARVRYQDQYQNLTGLSKDGCLYPKTMKKHYNIRVPQASHCGGFSWCARAQALGVWAYSCGAGV